MSRGYIQLQQTGEDITGNFLCWNTETITGSNNGTDIAIAWTEADGTAFTLTGSISGDEIRGTWIGVGPSGGSGTWRMEKVQFGGCDQTKPIVISTSPANGAVGVSRNLLTVSINFSDEMGPGYSYFPGGAGSVYWSSNLKTFYTTREDTGLLSPNTTITFTLNPAGYGQHFMDLYGNTLDEYAFSFTTGN